MVQQKVFAYPWEITSSNPDNATTIRDWEPREQSWPSSLGVWDAILSHQPNLGICEHIFVERGQVVLPSESVMLP